jgi:hypothetical protein
MVSILSLETLALLESDPEWFHKWKLENRKRKNAVICVRKEVSQKLFMYKIQLLNFMDDTGEFIDEEEARSLLAWWLFKGGKKWQK